MTPIVSAAQVEYRVAEGHGCGPESDRELDYRVSGMGGAQLWVGEGLSEVGLSAGAVFTAADADAARALMAGVHPGTGERLVEPVLRLPEEAKLPGTALVDAIIAADVVGSAVGSERGAGEWARLMAGCGKLGDGYRVDVRVLERVAARAGVDLAGVYGAERVAAAAEVAAGERIDVRTRGYDLTLTLPKSFSVAWAMAPAGQRQVIADAYTQAAVDTVTVAEGWHARATRGRHGDGERAEVVPTSGLLGWLSVDPVNRNGDAHWHAHVTLAGMGRAADGQWSALASAGTESLFSSVGALGGLMEARARALCEQRFGWTFRESALTGRLEVAHVSDAAIRATSTRRADVVRAMLAAGLDPAEATRAQDETAGQQARKRKVPGSEATPTVVQRTHAQLTAEGVDPDLPALPEHAMAVVMRPGEARARVSDGLEPGSWPARVSDARALLLDPARGVSAHARTFTYRQALGLVAARVHGGSGQAEYEVLLAAALDCPEIVALPATGSQPVRYTTGALVHAETTVLNAAAAGTGRPAGGMPARTVSDAHLAEAVTAFTRRAGYPPSQEQLTAVTAITQGGRALEVLTGLPGTGKTTVMRILGDAYARAGITVTGATVAAIAADGLSSQAGFPALTVAALKHSGIPEGTGVLVVDEAGMVDTRDMAALLTAAAQRGITVVAVGDERQLPAVGVGGWFAPARELAEGVTLTDVRRQVHEHELAALRAFRAGGEQDALTGYAAAGQVIVTDTRDEALSAAAAAWHHHAGSITDPLERAGSVALLAGRREDTQVLNVLARVHARQAGQLDGADAVYRLMGGGELHLAAGEVVVLRRNDTPTAVRNGQQAVIESIDAERTLTVRWEDAAGETRRVALTPGDVVAGMISASYLEADNVQNAVAGTVHTAQGRTVEHTVAVLDPHAHAATYVALSRDRASATVVLSAEAIAESPEQLAALRAMPVRERDAAVLAAYAQTLHQAGVTEAADRRLLVQEWPELLTHGREDRSGDDQGSGDVQGSGAAPGLAARLEALRQKTSQLARGPAATTEQQVDRDEVRARSLRPSHARDEPEVRGVER